MLRPPLGKITYPRQAAHPCGFCRGHCLSLPLCFLLDLTAAGTRNLFSSFCFCFLILVSFFHPDRAASPSVKLHDERGFFLVWPSIANGRRKHPLLHQPQRFRAQVRSFRGLYHRLVYLAVLADNSANGYIHVTSAVPFLRLRHRL